MALTALFSRAALPLVRTGARPASLKFRCFSTKLHTTGFGQQRVVGAFSTSRSNYRAGQRVYAAAYASEPGEMDVDADVIDDRMPVTVVTGFLGSGKTTLLNNILSQQHGRRIAIIENEFGDIDIDGSLIAHKEILDGEGGELVETLNGCACCTVRADLMGVLRKLVETKSDRYDHIVIETTGMADPRPILSIFTATEMMERLRLDGVVTLVDAKNVGRHLDNTKGVPEAVNEALEQIAYSDRIVLNKIDLVDEAAVNVLEKRIRSINSLATTYRTTNSAVPVDYVLGIGGFDLDRVSEEMEPPKVESSHSHEHHEAHSYSPGHEEHSHSHEEHSHSHEAHSHSHEEHSHSHAEHSHDHGHSEGHDHSHDHGHDHVHDDSVTSVSITVDGEMDLDMVNDWLGSVLYYMSENLYRYKGIMALKDEPNQYVFQGVHEQFIGASGREWREGEPRQSRMVFIGRDLEHDLLRDGFLKCREAASRKETAAARA